MIKALRGIPRDDNFFKRLEPFRFDKDQSIRVAAYSPEFATERTAVRITKFIISAAYGIPILSKQQRMGSLLIQLLPKELKQQEQRLLRRRKHRAPYNISNRTR